MLPLSLLNASVGHPMVVELKTGETYNGHLQSCDSWMNLNLSQVILTSVDLRFYKMAQVYLKGSTIKHVRIPSGVFGLVRDDQRDKTFVRRGARGGRGRGVGRGREGRDRGRGH